MGDDVYSLSLLVIDYLAPELYEDEVYVWEIFSVLRLIAPQDAEMVKKVTIAVVEQLVVLPGVETYFTGWPLEGDWTPQRSTMSPKEIVERVKAELDQLGREPVVLEIAFFRGVEGMQEESGSANQEEIRGLRRN